VQRVIETGDHPRSVAERRVDGDVLDALAVDIDFAPVAQRFKIFGAGHRLEAGGMGMAAGFARLRFHPASSGVGRRSAPDVVECLVEVFDNRTCV
jgi:hypothetical protein